jgi:hypothetical protein
MSLEFVHERHVARRWAARVRTPDERSGAARVPARRDGLGYGILSVPAGLWSPLNDMKSADVHFTVS